MKKVINFIKRNSVSLFFRNILNIRPVKYNFDEIKKYNFSSISDNFIWRTDKNYSTKFVFKDILKFFYNINNSKIEIIFFDKSGCFLKKINLKSMSNSEEIIIDKYLLNVQDYGTFNIFHNTKKKIVHKSIIANRCYIGFSNNKSFFSFVHGNHLSKSKSDDKLIVGFVSKSIYFNKIYNVQNNMLDYDLTEIAIANPNKSSIKFQINNNNYNLLENEIKIIEIPRTKIVSINSNCHLLRPIIFNYKNKFFDVYHG